MVADSMNLVLERAVGQLRRLRQYYDWMAIRAPSPTRELATFLRDREAATMSSLDAWNDEGHVAAWVRQGRGFPYQAFSRHLPSQPNPGALAGVAERTDRELRALFERLRTYAAADGAREDVEGLLAIAEARERSLTAAVRELTHG
jgi:hypothetical protein